MLFLLFLLVFLFLLFLWVQPYRYLVISFCSWNLFQELFIFLVYQVILEVFVRLNCALNADRASCLSIARIMSSNAWSMEVRASVKVKLCVVFLYKFVFLDIILIFHFFLSFYQLLFFFLYFASHYFLNRVLQFPQSLFDLQFLTWSIIKFARL